jgi:hypothetical protein
VTDHVVRRALLELNGLEPDSEVLWNIRPSGGTGGDLALAADRAMQETALYLAGPGDTVLLSEVDLAAREGGGHRGAARIRRLGDPAGGAPRLAVISPVAEMAGPDLHRGGLRLAFGPHAVAARWDDKVLFHRRILEAGLVRPPSWVVTDGSSAQAAARQTTGFAEVVVKSARARPRVLPAVLLEPYLRDLLAREEDPVLLEAYWENRLSLNVQLCVSGTNHIRVLDSVQLVSRDAEGRLSHCGNLAPATAVLAESRCSAHLGAARRAALAVAQDGYQGLVGIDTLEAPDGTPAISDCNPRVNASTFLTAVVEPGRLSLFWFGTVPAVHYARFRALASAAGDAGARLEICFSPQRCGDLVAINLLARATSLAALALTLRRLEQECPGYRAPLTAALFERVQRDLVRDGSEIKPC